MKDQSLVIYQFPTTLLYKEAEVLSVRKLYILVTVCKIHKQVLLSDDYENMLKARIFAIPVARVRSVFARRFADVAHPRLYNVAVKACDIKLLSTQKTKFKIREWLNGLEYRETENILRVINWTALHTHTQSLSDNTHTHTHTYSYLHTLTHTHITQILNFLNFILQILFNALPIYMRIYLNAIMFYRICK